MQRTHKTTEGYTQSVSSFLWDTAVDKLCLLKEQTAGALGSPWLLGEPGWVTGVVRTDF